jgi:alkylation response protein AidB-like acyl-CoA dehydrogenase
MDLHFSAEHRAFQEKVRTFVQENLPPDIREKVQKGHNVHKDDIHRWQGILASQGWLVPAWPEEHGGTGWSLVERHIFQEELAHGDAPPISPFGVTMVGPVIYTFGNAAQKQRFLPRIASNIDWWCQGYSEPGSGSDLASLQTKAIRDGDHYVVNGQKTWTSYADLADMIFCLVRTSTEGKIQAGISFLLIDMKSPGIEIQPIKTIDGGAEINSVFFTDVRVPVTNLVGEENKGWTYAKFLLGNERGLVANTAASKRQIAKLKEIAGQERAGGQYLIDDPDFRREIAEVEISLMSLEYTDLRYLMATAKGQPVGAEVSMLKVRGTEIQQRISELLVKALGNYAQPHIPDALEPGWNEDPIGADYAPALAAEYFNKRKTSIYGGSNEIQRNILAKMVLGL